MTTKAKQTYYFLTYVVLFSLLSPKPDVFAIGVEKERNAYFFQEQDTTITNGQDTTGYKPYEPTRRPTYNQRYRFGNPYNDYRGKSPLLLKDPTELGIGVDFDTTINYTIYEKMGGLDFRPPSKMSFQDYNNYQTGDLLKSYWKQKSAALDGESAVSNRGLIPRLHVSPFFDRLFGGSYVEIIPRGFVTLDFGGKWQRINNPTIPIRQQKSGGFEFDQQISMNVTGKIGEKLSVTANFDNNNSFDFQNNLKVEYTGYEEDIIKKLELGNVSLPLRNSLISGAQNLFGVKAQLQFGKLYVTGVASTQRGKAESMVIEGGSGGQGRPFDLIASDYDENRHFFLGQFFRDNYEKWLGLIPEVSSGVNVTRVEVYVLNRQNNTATLLNVVGLLDLAEPRRIYNGNINATAPSNSSNDNDGNDLFGQLNKNDDAISVDGTLQAIGLENGVDYEKITGARKLAENEYTVHPKLGYITLNRKLQNDEALAVAYQYTYNGQTSKVGELTEDFQNREKDKVVYMKMLRPRKINIRDNVGKVIPSWDLMMKNIYNLNAGSVEEEGFQLRVIYRDDNSGLDNPTLQEGGFQNTPLIELMGLDRLNRNRDRQKDGNFDYVEGVTIDPASGLIMFPLLEPFNTPLKDGFEGDPNEDYLVNKYVYDTLYRSTKADAQLVASKNKYFITGEMKSGSSSEISLRGFNIAEGSVKVFAGGVPLIEGTDYQVDYTFGKVRITNQGVLNSGKKITINYETADLFNFQTRTLLGTRLDYRLNEDVNFGGTLLYLNERPLVSRVSLGSEPARNIKYGFDVNVNKESRFLTKMVDFLPVIQTKEKSTVNFAAEFAQLIPGTSNKVQGTGTSYIDDFEASATPYNMGNPFNWFLASTPQTTDNRFSVVDGNVKNDLAVGYKRGKLAWYQIDNLFYRNSDKNKPGNISDEDLKNHFVREVQQQEIFRNRDPDVVNPNEPILDLAYYPAERGPYNFNPSLGVDGKLPDPKSNWGGMVSSVRTEVDFDKANIEYLEFWLMDPFINLSNNTPGNRDGMIYDGEEWIENNTGGELVFNLGSINEDVMQDGRHAFENGLPVDGSLDNVNTDSPWGNVTEQQYLTNAFDNSSGARDNQDVGLDGLNLDREKAKYEAEFPGTVWPTVEADPSADNFRHFLDASFDQGDAKILERYKDFNGLEKNSPVSDGNTVRSGRTIPDNEDLNSDNTLSDLEEYYEYTMKIKPANMQVGQNYIVDKIDAPDINGNGQNVSWYLFRVPINQGKKFGNISGFKSIRYIRTYLTEFEQPIVLRMANFRFVGSQWRRFTQSIDGPSWGDAVENDPFNFNISVVNIEENSEKNETQPGYVLPPGINRDRDNTSAVDRQQNEQSLQLCVDDLNDGDARAAYKDVTLDLINYGQIKMYISAHGENISDDETTAVLRLGTDSKDHFYEIEIPLKITNPEATLADDVWPDENQIDLALKELSALKAARNREGAALDKPYPLNGPKIVGKHKIRVLGSPKLSDVRRIMIGIRNPVSQDGASKSVCIWANELRVTDFDKNAGWAANASLNAKLADLGTVTASTRYTSFGFGSVQSKISERTREETTEYDIAASLNLDKFIPGNSGLKLPFFVSYEKSKMNPQFDPANPDITMEATLASFETVQERNDYLNIVQDNTERRSFNFSNVRFVKINPEKRSRIYDIENFSITYAYSDVNQTNFNTAQYLKENYRASLAYNFSPQPNYWEPFKGASMKSPYLKWLKDFNLNFVPSNLGFRGDVDRQFLKRVYRNTDNTQDNFEKYFYFNRTYNFKWNLSKSLSVDYFSRVHAVVDEPDGDIDSDEKRDQIWSNFRNLGRMKTFDQTVGVNYKLPLDKLPLTNWIKGDYRYETGYNWQAGQVGVVDTLNFGNIIQNNRTQTLTGKFDFVSLYNKSKYLKSINSPRRSRSSRSRSRSAQADTVKTGGENKGMKAFLRLLMSVRSVNFNYSVNDGTILPGFNKRAYLFGMDSTFSAPGWDFVFGSQNPGIRTKAEENGWLRENSLLSNPFTQTSTKNLSLRATIEPFKDFKVQLDANKRKSEMFQELFRYDDAQDLFLSLSPSRSGGYSVSFLSIKTAFVQDDGQNNSPTFQQFEKNRAIVKSRFENTTQAEYSLNSQDVLIPSFIAAYSGKDASEVSLSPFPKFPIPNWRLDYAGLGKAKGLKDKFRSINITHGYKSEYSITSFTNNLDYTSNAGFELNNNIEQYNVDRFGTQPNSDGLAMPIYNIGQVVVSEQFSPLIGVSVRTKSRMSIKVEYKTQRDIALNVSNTQITELNSSDFSMEFGYTKAKMKLPFKSNGRTITLENDIQFRLTLGIQDTRTVQRKIEEVNTITNGNRNFKLRPNINYVLNQKLNLQVYFERTINDPKISSSFKRSTTAFGVQIRFSLAQ